MWKCKWTNYYRCWTVGPVWLVLSVSRRHVKRAVAPHLFSHRWGSNKYAHTARCCHIQVKSYCNQFYRPLHLQKVIVGHRISISIHCFDSDLELIALIWSFFSPSNHHLFSTDLIDLSVDWENHFINVCLSFPSNRLEWKYFPGLFFPSKRLNENRGAVENIINLIFTPLSPLQFSLLSYNVFEIWLNTFSSEKLFIHSEKSRPRPPLSHWLSKAAWNNSASI